LAPKDTEPRQILGLYPSIDTYHNITFAAVDKGNTLHDSPSTMMMFLQEYLDHIRELVFNKDASFSDLFTIACAWAVVWAVFMPLVNRLLQPLLLQ